MLETLLQEGDTEERCGLILNDDTVIEIPNIAEDRRYAYEMNPISLAAFVDNVRATWHTHPDSSPQLSGEDMANFLWWPDLEHFIIGKVDGKVAVAKYVVEDGVVLQCD